MATATASNNNDDDDSGGCNNNTLAAVSLLSKDEQDIPQPTMTTGNKICGVQIVLRITNV